jgi:coatomer protein complex subunit alpha (xenin)
MNETNESIGAGWNDQDDEILFESQIDGKKKAFQKLDNLENNGWNENDLDLEIDINLGISSGSKSSKYDHKGNYFAVPLPGQSLTAKWFESSIPAEHVAGGSIETSLQLLNRQIVAVKFDSMKQNFVRAISGAQCVLPGLPLAPTNKIFLCRNATQTTVQSDMLPRAMKPSSMVPLLKQGYQYFLNGNFDDSMLSFTDLLHSLPLVVADSRNEESQIREFLESAREYITAIRIKQEISKTEDPIRQIELSAYTTHCNLQPGHLLLVLRLAMRTAFKYQNFITSASFARRLLELPDITSERNNETRVQAQKVVQKSEQMV